MSEMLGFKDLEFVNAIPNNVLVGGKRPLERAREKLLSEIDIQIQLVENPDLLIVKEVKKRDGSIQSVERRPRSWVTYTDDLAYVIVRILNKPAKIGGKKGAVIRCASDQVLGTLRQIREWAQSEDANELIEDAIRKSKRK